MAIDDYRRNLSGLQRVARIVEMMAAAALVTALVTAAFIMVLALIYERGGL